MPVRTAMQRGGRKTRPFGYPVLTRWSQKKSWSYSSGEFVGVARCCDQGSRVEILQTVRGMTILEHSQVTLLVRLSLTSINR